MSRTGPSKVIRRTKKDRTKQEPCRHHHRWILILAISCTRALPTSKLCNVRRRNGAVGRNATNRNVSANGRRNAPPHRPRALPSAIPRMRNCPGRSRLGIHRPRTLIIIPGHDRRRHYVRQGARTIPRAPIRPALVAVDRWGMSVAVSRILPRDHRRDREAVVREVVAVARLPQVVEADIVQRLHLV